jgi:peptidoglycan/LPS O-acetylase OafA/YrhL
MLFYLTSPLLYRQISYRVRMVIVSMTISMPIAMFITMSMSTGSETANLRFIEGPYNAI